LHNPYFQLNVNDEKIYFPIVILKLFQQCFSTSVNNVEKSPDVNKYQPIAHLTRKQADLKFI